MMYLNRSPWLLMAVCIWLAACESEHIEEIQRIASPDAQVVAVYRKYLYGGAAGGVGYCVVLSSTLELPRAKCLFLASRVNGLKLSWHERVLEISYKEATITNFSNKSYVPGPDGQLISYEIRLSKYD